MTEIQDLQSAEYKLTHFEAGDFTDNHGNYWCNATFEGISEPVRWVVKDPTAVKVGESYFGHFTLETSKAKNTYIRFRREQKPDVPHAEPQQAALPVKQDDTYWDDKNSAIKAQFAIKAGIQAFGKPVQNMGDVDSVESLAHQFYVMVDRVKDVTPKAHGDEPVKKVDQTGYEKAKATANAIKQTFSDGSPVPDEVHDNFDESEPIDLKDIPF